MTKGSVMVSMVSEHEVNSRLTNTTHNLLLGWIISGYSVDSVIDKDAVGIVLYYSFLIAYPR